MIAIRFNYEAFLEVRLEKLPCPTFQGKIRDYARFKRDFLSIVESQVSDPVVRLHYLQNLALVDKPKELVENLVTYQEAWDRLDQHYEESDMKVNAVVKEIEQLKFSNEGESKIVIKLFDVLKSE